MIHFYKANAKVTGSACSFYLSDRDGTFFSQFLKQASWNEKTRTGSFAKDDPSKKASIKFTDIEIAGIIDALESDREYSGYHSSEKQIATFKFSPYIDKASGTRRGFSYSLTKEAKDDSTNKLSFVIGLTFPEARRLRQHLEFLLNRFDGVKASMASERQFDNTSERPPERQPERRPERQQESRPAQDNRSEERVRVKEHNLEPAAGHPSNGAQDDGDIW